MAWLLAARPKTLFASISPVLLGLGIVEHEGFLDVQLAGFTLLTTILIQILTNYINDYYDFKKGADVEERVGPARMLQTGRIQPEAMKKAIFSLVILCLFLGGWLVKQTDYYILLIGILSLIFAYLYTGGAYSLAYHGLGEIFVFLFFGPVAVIGSYYTQRTFHFTFDEGTKILLVSIAPGLLSMLILMVNNIRDYETDRKQGKNTLVVKLGLLYSKILYVGISVVAISNLFFLIPRFGKGVLLVLMIVPLMFISIRKIYFHKKIEELNQVLTLNGLILFLFCVLFLIGYNLSVLRV